MSFDQRVSIKLTSLSILTYQEHYQSCLPVEKYYLQVARCSVLGARCSVSLDIIVSEMMMVVSKLLVVFVRSPNSQPSKKSTDSRLEERLRDDAGNHLSHSPTLRRQPSLDMTKDRNIWQTANANKQ